MNSTIMRKQSQLITLAGVICLICGCSPKDYDSLKKDVADLKSSKEIEELLSGSDSVAYLTPGSEGYSPIRFDLGVLTVSLKEVKPYANGTKAILSFGNPLSANIKGFKCTIDWGRIGKDGSPQNEQQKTKEFVLSEDLVAGYWTNVPVVLEGIPHNEFGFIRVRAVTHRAIVLINR